jgi:sec-independent protein translocase protein TatB
MFDVGFWELMLVGVVALLVLGPERLPEVARTAGRWIGAARRMAATFKADIDREIRAEELKKILAKQTEFKGAYEVLEETRQGLQSAVDQLNAPVDAPGPSAPVTPPGHAPALSAGPAGDTASGPAREPATPGPAPNLSAGPALNTASGTAREPATPGPPAANGEKRRDIP